MKLTFLEADIPLQKTFYLDKDGKVLDSKPYPMVKNFTSYDIDISSLTEMYIEINKAANKGHALLRGNLKQPIKNESRAGMTDPTSDLWWVLIDVDNVDINESPFDQYDHILQYSSSYKIKTDYLSAHYFALCEPTTWEELKNWTKQLNLTQYKDYLQANRLGTALKWPLDISVCDPSKIIYIAPPKLINIEGKEVRDPLDERTSLYTGGKNRVPIKVTEPIKKLEEAAKEKLLNKKIKTQSKNGVSNIMINAPKANVTGVKSERGFTYLNLNGGDSWGYYFPDDDPTILYNFKGEPNYYLEQIAPEIWEEKKGKEEKEGKLDNGVYRTKNGIVVSCILENEDTYAYIEIDEKAQDIKKILRFGARSRLNEKLRDVGLPQIEKAPCFEIITDFQNDQILDVDNRLINTFKKTNVLKHPIYTGEMPKEIDKVLRHLCKEDEFTYQHLIKWLAAIVQFRKSLRTAWVFTGVQGTGKGVLFNIMQRIIGYEYTLNPLLGQFDDQFISGSLDGKLFVMVDEADQESSKNAPNILAKLKQSITEERVTIRKMRKEAYLEFNNLNFIFCSNKRAPMEIELSDRRFNVAPYQDQRLIDIMSLEDINDKALSDEQIKEFCGFLLNVDVDIKEVQKAINTEAKRELIETSLNSFSRTIEELRNGNLDYFLDNAPGMDGSGYGFLVHSEEVYKQELVHVLSEGLEQENWEHVHHIDAIKAFVEVITGNTYKGKGRFTTALRKEHYTIANHHSSRVNKTVYGSKIRWSLRNKDLGWQVLRELRGTI